jgi:thiol-disulfide isomerase/thioredoxin
MQRALAGSRRRPTTSSSSAACLLQQQPCHTRIRRPARPAAAAGNADGGTTSITPSDDAAATKTPWWSKNNEGWTSVASSADLARAAHAARCSGKRIVALELWAPTCGVCKSSWPALSRLARDDALARDVLFAKASIEGEDIRRLLREERITGIPFCLVLDVGEAGTAVAAPPLPPAKKEGEEEETVRGLLGQMLGQFVARKLGGGGNKKGGEAASAAEASSASAATATAAAASSAGGGTGGGATGVLAEASTTLVLSQGASFKKIAVLRSNLATVPALVKRGSKVIVDPNGLVVAV